MYSQRWEYQRSVLKERCTKKESILNWFLQKDPEGTSQEILPWLDGLKSVLVAALLEYN